MFIPEPDLVLPCSMGAILLQNVGGTAWCETNIFIRSMQNQPVAKGWILGAYTPKQSSKPHQI